MKKFAVNWDNGNSACGTFPNRFDTREEAQVFADEWAEERNREDLNLSPQAVEELGGESCYTAEVIELDEPDPPEEMQDYPRPEHI